MRESSVGPFPQTSPSWLLTSQHHIGIVIGTDLSHNDRAQHLPWLEGLPSGRRDIMIQLYTTLVSLLVAGKDGLSERVKTLSEQDPERGAISLETVVVAAGLLLAALAVIAAIAAAVTGRLGGIR